MPHEVNADEFAAHLLALFEKWTASSPGRGRRASGTLALKSAEVYRDMWKAFVAFCVPGDSHARWVRINPLKNLRTEDLQAFLSVVGPGAEVRGRVKGETLALRYAWRMLHLIDRVLTHAKEAGERSGPTAAAHLLLQAPYRTANSPTHDPSTPILNDGEVQCLIEALQGELPGKGNNKNENGSDSGNNADGDTGSDEALKHWKLLRDRALVALMLGAGLAPGDVQALSLDGIAYAPQSEGGLPSRLTVPADGLSPQHQTPLAAWSARVLLTWLTVRQARNIPGRAVFVSTAAGKSLSRPWVHTASVRVLAAAGIAGGTPFRLRHTFAVRQLSKGFSEEEVGAWLGLVEPRAMHRYRVFVTRAADLA
jgi:integrase